MIPLSRPGVGEVELEGVRTVLESGWLGEGRSVEEFEAWLGQYTGCPHVVAVSTGTAALHLALRACGVGPGDEVVMPSFTFVADAMAVRMCGATPVFCDIEPRSLNIDCSQVARHLSSRTRAIMPTDYAGLPVDTQSIREVLGHPGVRIVRDASHSFGSRHDGRPLGLMDADDLTCFSFDPIKNITCGEGGAILLREDELDRALRAMRRLGLRDSAWDGFKTGSVVASVATQDGYRYHMSNINAAIGLAQASRAGELLDRRRQIARLYDRLLDGVPHLALLPRNYDEVCPFMYVMRVEGGHRDGLVEYLSRHGIHAGLRYIPCHLHPLFADADRPALPVTERIAQEAVSIPLYYGLTDEQVSSIAARAGEYLGSR